MKKIKLVGVLWSSIFVTLMANKIGGLQFGIYRTVRFHQGCFTPLSQLCP